MSFDEKYMRRALRLAALGEAHAAPNPMVGAVIVAPDGRIIGEGWHRRCGEGHAEVNAIASVPDRDVLRTATMYVTLEPCSHWGRTPPCARLIIDCGIPRVAVAATDPFPAVSGRGIAMLREAGVEVLTGMLAEDSLRLNARFITAHTRQRPFTMLKWAQSADGYLDRRRDYGAPSARISTPLTQLLMHRSRSRFDAILVGSGTVLADNPRLDARLWPGGRAPRPAVADRRHRVAPSAHVMQRSPLLLHDADTPAEILATLYREGITSVMVEGGSALLHSFAESGLWDVARVEVSPARFGTDGASPAPCLGQEPLRAECVDGNNIFFYSNNPLVDVKKL